MLEKACETDARGAPSVNDPVRRVVYALNLCRRFGGREIKELAWRHFNLLTLPMCSSRAQTYLVITGMGASP